MKKILSEQELVRLENLVFVSDEVRWLVATVRHWQKQAYPAAMRAVSVQGFRDGRDDEKPEK